MRCPWAETHELFHDYHDKEWGTPVWEDRVHFEFLVLESAQAGLSWLTVLKKRENYRKEYENFDPEKVAQFDGARIEKMLQNPGIIRNRMKVEASVNNAKRFLEIQKEFGSFSKYIWSFVDNKPVINHWDKQNDMPATTELSDRLAKDMKKRGFKFLGSTVMYAHLQAMGLVNDHIASCFRYRESAGK